MKISRLLAAVCVSFALMSANRAFAGETWKPVDPAQLALAAPVVDKDADAEVLFWDVRVADDASSGEVHSVLTHYLRIKVFTERGKESVGQVDIPYLGRNKVDQIAGRTIKRDGTIVELKPDAVFDRTIIKANGLRVNAKSFAMPAVEPGAIIEYRYRETKRDQLANYLRLEFQRDIPVESVTYHVKPLSLPGFDYGMKFRVFNAANVPFTKEGDGFYATTMTNVPAFHEEPRMIPSNMVRPWMLIYYSPDTNLAPEAFWKNFGKSIYNSTKNNLKVNDDVRKAAAEIIGDATTPDDKLARLYEFCRTKVKNINDDALTLTDDERKKYLGNKSPADTLKRGGGTESDVTFLFGALAIAAGFDARTAIVGDRGDVFFDLTFADSYFLNAGLIAVKVGDEWRFADPSESYLPYGMLRWNYEAQPALVSDPNDPVWARTPLASAEQSVRTSTAALKLDDEGTLEGDVRVEFTGHFGREKKEYNDDDSEAEREKTLVDSIKQRMSAAEVTAVKVENVTDPDKPFAYAYHVRVPGYAQRTGKRLFIQPAFFEYGVDALFPTSARKYDVYFSYPWSEQEDVMIDVPEGFTLDNADAPSPMRIGDIGTYSLAITAEGAHTIRAKRSLSFGAKGTILFPTSSYPQLKGVFDAMHERDTHVITLKQATQN